MSSTREERREQRALIDGRLVSIVAPSHGKQWVYNSYACRCIPCTKANTEYIAQTRKTRYAERVMIDGALVHPRARHGSGTSYISYGCRCMPCTEAHRVDCENTRGRKRDVQASS